MLLEFSCSNHKSFREKVLFSTLAGTDNTYEDKIYIFDGLRILKSAVLYGANGSGKSNFIDAISFVKFLVVNSVSNTPGQGIRQVPHKIDGYKKESVYSIQFVTNNIRYAYGFSLKEMLVVDEYLYYFPNGRQTKIFERTFEKFSAGSKFRGKLNTCKDVLKSNRLLLTCAANFSSVEEIVDAYRFFAEELVIYTPGNEENWMNYSLYQMHKDKGVKDAVITFMNDLGVGIKDVEVTIDEKQFESSNFKFLLNEYKNSLLKNKVDAKVIYDSFETDLIDEESSGVKRLFGMLCPLIDIMTDGKVLVCDEIESGLHESLVFGLVKLFMEVNGDKYGQMIFTTHETGLLNLDIFRRDQIWFTELKEEDRSTDLYSLVEIKNVRKEDNFKRGYISGKYGAIPMLNLNYEKSRLESNMEEEENDGWCGVSK